QLRDRAIAGDHVPERRGQGNRVAADDRPRPFGPGAEVIRVEAQQVAARLELAGARSEVRMQPGQRRCGGEPVVEILVLEAPVGEILQVELTPSRALIATRP